LEVNIVFNFLKVASNETTTFALNNMYWESV